MTLKGVAKKVYKKDDKKGTKSKIGEGIELWGRERGEK